MSVTITIANNRKHTIDNGAMQYDEYDCQRCEFDGKNPECRECKPYGGNGKVRFERLPFEMNVANGNFAMLWNALALPFDYCGSIDARQVLPVVNATTPELLIRATDDSGSDGGVRVIRCGVGYEQAESYLTRLKAIAEEAARREEPIVWG